MLMISPTATPPPIGTISVGEMLADAQSKTLWLGVASTVDPAEAVLLADMLAVDNGLDQCLLDAKSYTDTKVAGCAPTVHRHEISDVNGLQAALASGANSIPVGCIILWSGTIITIPAGFVLCNGLNGTPNLTDKFVMGAGGAHTQGSQGGAASLSGVTDVQGAHSHTGVTGGHVLSVAEMAYHNHGVNDPAHTHGAADAGHVHSVPSGGGSTPLPFGSGAGSIPTLAGQQTAYGYASISVSANYTGISVAYNGGNVAHNHPITVDGSHQHNLSNISTLPPFYVLAFIQRIA